MTVAKQQPRPETFNPKKRSPRHQQTERAFQMAVRVHLMGLLNVMNPMDQIHYGGMLYPDLVVYAYDWLKTEVVELAAQGYEAAKAGNIEEPTEEPGLGLDLG